MAENIRYNYIEPSNIVAGERQDRDNEVWVMEDYNMSVDLQVIMPDRLKTFSLNRDNLMVSVKNSNRSPLGRYLSFMRGTKDGSGQGNSLTDSYINASYSELTRTGASDPECLGISNVHIKLDEHFYPQVSITFVDVRGYSLMMPSELAYSKHLKGEKVDAELNFFSSLFQFPYPMFLLTVKGHYGDRVTFQLTVNEFHNSFNSETGNFEVTVDFIGFLYGLYTDIPVNFIIAAPYYGKTDTSTYCEYWQQKIDSGEFNFSDGGKILTFIEYVEALHNVNKSIASETMSEIKSGQVKIEEQVASLTTLQGLFDTACRGMYNTNIKFEKDICYLSDGRYYLYTKRRADGTNKEYEYNDKNVGNFNGKVDDYNSRYGGKIHKITKTGMTQTEVFAKVSGYDDLVKALESTLEKKDLLKKLVSYEKNLECVNGYFIYDSEIIKKEIDKEKSAVIEKLEAYNKEHEEQLENEAKEMVSKGLGFPPTVENIYRMIFAHIDCFLHLFYELIDDIENNKDGRSPKDLGADFSHDISGLGDKIDYMPPFPNIFKDNKGENKPNELLWIGSEPKFSNFSEVKFVEDMFKAVIATKNKANDIFKQDLPSFGSGSDFIAPTFDYYPSLATDIFYMDNGPFDVFETSAGQFDNEYLGALLYYEALRMKAYYFSTSFPNETNGTNRLKENLKLRARLDAYNYIKRNSTCSDALSKGLSSVKQDKETKVFETYKKFKKNHEKILEDRILCHVKSIIKKDNDLDYKNFGLGDAKNAGEDRFYAWTGPTIATPKAFSEAWNKPLPESKIFEGEEIKKAYENTNRGAVCKIDGEPTTAVYAYDYKSGQKHNITTDKGLENKEIQTTCRLFSKKEGNKDMSKEDYAKMCAEEATSPSADRYVQNAYYYRNDKRGFGNLLNLFIGSAYPSNIQPLTNFNNNPTNGGKLKMLTLASMGSGTEMRFGNHANIFNNRKNTAYCTTSLHQIGLEAASAFFIKSGNMILEKRGANVGDFLSVFETYEGNPKKIFEIKYSFKNIDRGLSGARQHRAPINDLYNLFIDKNTSLQEIFESVNKNKYAGRVSDTLYLNTNLSTIFKRYLTEPAVYLHVTNNYAKPVLSQQEQDTERYYKTHHTVSMEDFNKVLPKALKEFVVGLEYGYGETRPNEESGTTDNGSAQVNTAGSGMVTNSHKLAAYESLKQLYDKWLTVYGPENFALKSYEETKEHRYSRYVNPSGRLDNNSEFDNFIYMDSFYRDISNDFYINPRSLYDMLKNHIDANSNYSVYELLYDVAQENKMLFIALPVYSNYYSKQYLENMFKPNVMYGSNDVNVGNMGSTYILLYPHEVSHMTEEDGDNGYLGFKNDGFRLDQDGINLDKTVQSILATKDAEGNSDYVIPAFGVTYAKQNQSYFKNVTVNMNNPRVTDTSIANIFYLGNLGVNGDLASPAAVGQDLYSIYSDRSYTCSVDMMGCMNIMPVMYFQLNNVPLFRGAYMITDVEHQFTPGKSSTRFTGVRMSNKILPFNEQVFNLKDFFDYMHVDMPAGMTTYQPAGITEETSGGSGGDLGPIISGIESNDLKKVIYTASANVAYCTKGWYVVRGMSPNYDIIKNSSYFYNDKIGNETITKTVKGQCTSAPTTWYKSIGLNLVWWSPKKVADSSFEATKQNFENQGFKLMWHGGSADWKAKKAELTKQLRPGDICTQHYYESDGNPSSHGCMYNGREWLSDFKQGDMLAGQSFKDRQGEYSYCIWRYKAFWSDCN